MITISKASDMKTRHELDELPAKFKGQKLGKPLESLCFQIHRYNNRAKYAQEMIGSINIPLRIFS